MEGAQDVEAAGERGDELAVLAVRSLGETILDGALESGGSRDEMTDVAHGRFSPVNGRLFLCGAERAIALPLPQCAGAGFVLRTCKAAMSQARDSLSTVEKA
jgi:hypothetical protein